MTGQTGGRSREERVLSSDIPVSGTTRRVGRAVKAHPRLSATGAVVVLAGAAVGSYFAVSGGGGTPAAAPTTTTTQTVSTGTIKQTVSASGTLAPAYDDTLSFSPSGVVTAVKVSEGQRVSKGQTLATINSASLAADLAQAKATVASDKAKVDNDESNEATDAQLTADEAALAAARTHRDSAHTALDAATLTSPINGMVATVGLTVGQSVSGGSSGGSSGSGGGSGSSGFSGATTSTTSASSTGIEVISTDAWVVNASVDATSVDMLKVGDQAQLTVTGATDTVYGTVSSIAVLSSSSSGTASYPVVIKVTGTPSGLHDGESVTASLIYKQLSNVIVVPTTALHRNTDGSEYVNKVVDGKVQQTTVQVGTTSGAQVQITSGLTAGDTIQIQQFTRPRGSGSTTGRTGGGGGFGTGNFPGGGQFPGGGDISQLRQQLRQQFGGNGG